MTHRLLSLLSQIEDYLRESDPDTIRLLQSTRSVNYQKGLARLTLQSMDGTPWGAATVQGYRLANGETCLKLALTCGRSEIAKPISLFPRESHDWANEARKIAVLWLEEAQAVQALAEESGVGQLQAAAG
ncbi:MAG: hypothetical protein HY302_08975 [Opitutae bacterium]|nr:hypothetical protein [Opitutae bacterium]